MSAEYNIIVLEYEAIKTYARGNKTLMKIIIKDFSALLREYIEKEKPRAVSVEELINLIKSAVQKKNDKQINALPNLN